MVRVGGARSSVRRWLVASVVSGWDVGWRVVDSIEVRMRRSLARVRRVRMSLLTQLGQKRDCNFLRKGEVLGLSGRVDKARVKQSLRMSWSSSDMETVCWMIRSLCEGVSVEKPEEGAWVTSRRCFMRARRGAQRVSVRSWIEACHVERTSGGMGRRRRGWE